MNSLQRRFIRSPLIYLFPAYMIASTILFMLGLVYSVVSFAEFPYSSTMLGLISLAGSIYTCRATLRMVTTIPELRQALDELDKLGRGDV